MHFIHFDLSELLYGSSSRLSYHGIARTVVEVAYELAKGPEDVKFVIFSPAHQSFFYVDPTFTTKGNDLLCDLGLSAGASPLHLRRSFPNAHALRDLLSPVAVRVLRYVNMRRWQANRGDTLTPAAMRGQTLVAFTRPKIMVDYVEAMARQKVQFRFCPLLHDMIPLHDIKDGKGPKFAHNFRHDNAEVIAGATLLLANSEFTKTEIALFSEKGLLPKNLSDICTIPLAHEFRDVDDGTPYEIPKGPYFLCVGTQTGRKNIECVLKAMVILEKAGRAVPRLVLAGARRKRTDTYLARPEFDGIRPQVAFRINPSQAELGMLYKQARGLVIPSRMEGWGLPLGEAMWLGTPGIAATADALKEVGGEHAFYFDPDVPDQLADILSSLSTDDEAFYAAREAIQQAKSSFRSWAQVAQEVVNCVRPSAS
ncbi:glycosyltransferase family 1 protein [uncultured Sulfitobacter sp.]|uniref:glycosyltransferase family 4 protein n=1 Tax=uncultured Sulfitobacter sp. TaxID=191468 RepID=UPI00261A884E|nr:glycosyltransferase family 1 protein [uncultured Sulfitobacter sp.]